MINLAQRRKSVSSALVHFLKSILARFILKVDADEAAAALAKDVERKAREAARSKARRDARKLRNVEYSQPEIPTAVAPEESAVATAVAEDESADSDKTTAVATAVASEPPKKCAFPSLAVRPPRRLSLLRKLDPVKESESGRRVALPHDWGPNLKVREFAIKRLGDQTAADLCFEKFRVRHETSGEEWTLREWQSRARGWVLLEEQFFGRQRNLPLLARVGDAMTAPPGFYASALSPQLAAWDAYERRVRGKSKPRDRKGGWWVESEWPPDHDETRQAS